MTDPDGLVVVLGATGGIGRAVVGEALTRGRRVRAGSRSASSVADHTGRVRAATAADLLDRCARGDLRVVVGRASDYDGPHGTTTALGATFFPAALRGRAASVVGSADTLHTMSHLPTAPTGPPSPTPCT